MDEYGTPTTGDGPFDDVDPKLTVFALANGMDLVKSETTRRLEWFTEGWERGLEVVPAGSGLFSVTGLAWKRKHEDEAKRAPISDDTSAADLMALLDRSIETVNAM